MDNFTKRGIKLISKSMSFNMLTGEIKCRYFVVFKMLNEETKRYNKYSKWFKSVDRAEDYAIKLKKRNDIKDIVIEVRR